MDIHTTYRIDRERQGERETDRQTETDRERERDPPTPPKMCFNKLLGILSLVNHK